MNELNGAWEEPGVIGLRIEINEPEIIVLWRNAQVLKTTYKIKQNANEIELVLDRNGLRYENSNSDYAIIKSIIYKENYLELVEDFPISGESVTKLKKTENSRYGNYEIVDDILKELQGDWKSDDGFAILSFKDDTLSLGGEIIKVHALKSKSEKTNTYKIVNQDSSKYEVFHFQDLLYDGKTLVANFLILDEGVHLINFNRQ